jgi:hypothetical protein
MKIQVLTDAPGSHVDMEVWEVIGTNRRRAAVQCG